MPDITIEKVYAADKHFQLLAIGILLRATPAVSPQSSSLPLSPTPHAEMPPSRNVVALGEGALTHQESTEAMAF